MSEQQLSQVASYVPLTFSILTGIGFFAIQIIGTRLESLARGPRPDDRFHAPENTLYAASVTAAIIIAYSIDSETAPVLSRIFGGLGLPVLILWLFFLILAWTYSIKEKIRITKYLIAKKASDLTIETNKGGFWLMQVYNWVSALTIPLSISAIAIR